MTVSVDLLAFAVFSPEWQALPAGPQATGRRPASWTTLRRRLAGAQETERGGAEPPSGGRAQRQEGRLRQGGNRRAAAETGSAGRKAARRARPSRKGPEARGKEDRGRLHAGPAHPARSHELARVAGLRRSRGLVGRGRRRTAPGRRPVRRPEQGIGLLRKTEPETRPIPCAAEYIPPRPAAIGREETTSASRWSARLAHAPA